MLLIILMIFLAPVCPGAENKAGLPEDAPFVSIIIDDLGEQLPTPKEGLIQKLLALSGDPDFVLTAGVLPQGTHSRKIAGLAEDHGLEVIINQPMEPGPYWKWPGILESEMTDAEIIRMVEEHIKKFPQADGMNNYMGSLLTSNPRKMVTIFKVLSKRGLYFIDSRTSDKSVCAEAAAAVGLLFGERSVELDSAFPEDDDANIIAGKIRALADQALSDPSRSQVCILHPRPSTIQALETVKPDLKLLGVAVRPVSWSTEMSVDAESQDGVNQFIMNGIWEEAFIDGNIALTPSDNNPENWASVTVFFNISKAGKYSVNVRDLKNEAAKDIEVEYAIYHEDGIARGSYKQEPAGGSWEKLGTYSFKNDQRAAIYLKIPIGGYFQGVRLLYRGKQ